MNEELKKLEKLIYKASKDGLRTEIFFLNGKTTKKPLVR